MSCSRRVYSNCGRTCAPPCSCSVSNSLGTSLTTVALTGASDAVAINDAPLTLYIPCVSNVTVTFSGSVSAADEESPAQVLGVQLSATNTASLYTPATTLEDVCPRAYVASVNPIPISITTIFTLVPGTYSFSTLLFNESDGVSGSYSVRGNLTVLAVKTSTTLLL